MIRTTLFRSMVFVAASLLTIRSGFAQNAPFTGSMDVKVQSGKLENGKAQFKPAQTRKVYFKGNLILIDSINLENKTVRLILDQSTKKITFLFQPGGDIPMAMGGSMNIKFAMKMGLMQSAKTNDLGWTKGVDLKFIEGKQKRTVEGKPVKRVELRAAKAGFNGNKADTLALWMSDKAGLKLSDYNTLFSTLGDTSVFDEMRSAVSKAPATIKDGWPLHIYYRDDAKSNISNLYFQNIKSGLTPAQEALFDTSNYMIIDLEQVLAAQMKDQGSDIPPPPDEDMNSAPGE